MIPSNSIKKIALALVIFALVSLPFYQAGQPAQAASASQTPLLLGVHPQGYIDQTTIDNELHALDDWAGKRVSISAISFDIEEPHATAAIPAQLDALWDNGYTAFINLLAGTVSDKPTAAQIAAGEIDAGINQWAQAYASWASNGKWAFIALLPEMNADWYSYGMDPDNYRMAYVHIQQLFTQNNVSSRSVRWVFAPNGWTNNPFDAYYPESEGGVVDVVGSNGYNFGFCPKAVAKNWKNPKDVFGPTIQKLRALAPDKPIFITGAGTTAYTSSGQSADAKNQWLRDSYNYLARTLGVQAILYSNVSYDWDCDWAFYKVGGVQYEGYRDAAANPAYSYVSPAELGGMDMTPHIRGVFLPLAVNSHQSCSTDTPVMIALYTSGWPGNESTMANELHPMDNWAGKRLSMVGTYIDIQVPDANTHVAGQLNLIWENNYTPYINMTTSHSAYDIAAGILDKPLRAWAQAFAAYARMGGGRMAFIGPLQEMNGNWVPYGLNPTNFKLAYARIQQIFQEEGVPVGSVKWVFAPNGWSDPGQPPFEDYYPGDDSVDVVAFSAYNFGYNPHNSYPDWETPQEVFGPYLERMRLMAPNKPIFISQTATTGYTSGGYSASAKNQWLVDAYSYLAGYPAVRAIVYFNLNGEGFDWPVYVPDDPSHQFQGYQTAVANPNICYVSPNELMRADLSVK
jgi:beta-mannanase